MIIFYILSGSFWVLPLEKWIFWERRDYLAFTVCIFQYYLGWMCIWDHLCSTLCPSHHSRTLTLPAIFIIWIGSFWKLCHIMHLKRRTTVWCISYSIPFKQNEYYYQRFTNGMIREIFSKNIQYEDSSYISNHFKYNFLYIFP